MEKVTGLTRLICLMAVFLIVSAAGALAQEEGVDDGFGGYPFPGAVDGLPPESQPGQPFRGHPAYQLHIEWAAIPTWLAGDWTSSDYRIMQSLNNQTGEQHNLPTSKNMVVVDHFGDLQDRQGTVWAAMMSPYVMNLPNSGFTDSQQVIGIKALSVSGDGIELWQRIVHVVYDPNSGAIQDSFIEERVSQIAPSGPGLALATVFNRYFDAAGRATVTTRAIRVMRRTRAFQPSGQRDGVDLQSSFAQYLTSSGRPELIP